MFSATRTNVSAEKILVNTSFDGEKGGFTPKKQQNVVVKRGSLHPACKSQQVFSTDKEVYSAFELPNQIVFFAWNGFSRITDGKEEKIGSLQFTNPVYLHCQKQNALILSQKGEYTAMYTEEGVSTICNVGMESLALCKERVVGVADNKVYFSDVDDFSSWNEITLPEKVCAVTQLQEDVLLFGKDVLRLNFGKDVADTTVETVCRNVGIPFAQTLCAVGNSVVYLTANGLMKFKNSSVTKLAEAFADNAEAQATVLGGKYVVCCNTEEQKGVLLETDCETGQSVVIGKADFVTANGDRLLFGMDGKVCTFGEEKADAFWQSYPQSFGNAAAKKHLRKLTVDAVGSVEVHLIGEIDKKVFRMQCKNPQTVHLQGTFHKLTLEILTFGNAVVHSVGVLAEIFQLGEV